MKNSNKAIVSSPKEGVIISYPSQQRMNEIKSKLEEIGFPAKLKELQEKLENDKSILREKVDEALKQEIVQYKKKLFIFDTIDEEATLSNIIKQSNQNIKSTEAAIVGLNCRMRDLINIIMVITNLENDLYSLIEGQSIDANELKAVLCDVFKAQGMSEGQIYDLLDNSFKRGYILRERIAELRNDFDRLRDYFEKIQNRENEIEVEFKEKIKTIESSIGETQNELTDIRKKIEIFDELSNKISELERNISEKADISELYSLQEQFKELAQNHSIEFAELKEEITQGQADLKAKMNKKADVEVLSSYVKTNDIFTKEAVRKKLRNLWIAYGVTTAALIGGLIVSFLL